MKRGFDLPKIIGIKSINKAERYASKILKFSALNILVIRKKDIKGQKISKIKFIAPPDNPNSCIPDTRYWLVLDND